MKRRRWEAGGEYASSATPRRVVESGVRVAGERRGDWRWTWLSKEENRKRSESSSACRRRVRRGRKEWKEWREEGGESRSEVAAVQ